jgi:hypothetical protein
MINGKRVTNSSVNSYDYVKIWGSAVVFKIYKILEAILKFCEPEGWQEARCTPDPKTLCVAIKKKI